MVSQDAVSRVRCNDHFGKKWVSPRKKPSIHGWVCGIHKKKTLPPGYLFQNNRAHGIRLSRLRKLQEALYLACEHGYLNIALELRSIGVMWNLNFWTRYVKYFYFHLIWIFFKKCEEMFAILSSPEMSSLDLEKFIIFTFTISSRCLET